MTSIALTSFVRARSRINRPLAVAAAAFALCFAPGIIDLVHAWLTIPDAAHGILIAPVALWLAWTTGVVPEREPWPWVGSLLVGLGVVMYVLGRTAGAETTPRLGLGLAVVGLVLWYGGWRQITAWWLPLLLLALTIPLPEAAVSALTLPLQGVAARMGAGLIAWRHIPVMLTGNVIALPGHTLFVSEACSGLRSLTALVSMAILVGALFLKSPLMRAIMLALAVGLAIVVNGIRVFLTAFLVFFVDPRLGEGFMHLTEGYLLFIVSLAVLALLTWACREIERRVHLVPPAGEA